MSSINHVHGVQEVIAHIKATHEQHAKKCQQAITRCTLLLERYAKALVPVQTGHLKASGYSHMSGSGFDTVGKVAFTAEYAVWVHEDLTALHGSAFNTAYASQIATAPPNDPYWFNRGKDQQAKFLLGALNAHREEFLGILKAVAK